MTPSRAPRALTAASGTQGQPSRLASGQVRVLVLAHLRAWPDLDFSPTDLARAIGRPHSRGAVINACRSLAADALAVRTHDHPQRYQSTRGRHSQQPGGGRHA
jgi:hypothetical protein